VLGDGVTPAGEEAVNAARTLYWRRYGATMLGLVKHHNVRAAHFLHETHEIDDLTSMIRAERGLRQLLRRLPGRKILLTNAPHRYSTQVLRHLGLQREFGHHVSVEAMTVHRQMRPKPSKLLLRKLMRTPPPDARPLHPGRGHAGQPAQRPRAGHAHRVDHPISDGRRRGRSRASAKTVKSPRLCRCQSKICQETAGTLAAFADRAAS
jgi:hypothetical protein